MHAFPFNFDSWKCAECNGELIDKSDIDEVLREVNKKRARLQNQVTKCQQRNAITDMSKTFINEMN